MESCPITEEYEGLQIVGPDKMSDEIQMVVIIPTYDMDVICRKVKACQLVVGVDEILNSLLSEG